MANQREIGGNKLKEMLIVTINIKFFFLNVYI